MFLVRVIAFCLIALVSAFLTGCEYVGENPSRNLQDIFTDAVESFDEAWGLDSEQGTGDLESIVAVSPMPAPVQGEVIARSAPKLTDESRALQAVLIESAEAAEANYDYKLATMHYSRLVEMNPGDIASVLGFARNLRYIGNSKAAVLLLKKALSSLPKHVDLRIQLVKAQIASGFLEEAAGQTDYLLRTAPAEWEVYALEGVILDHHGKFLAAQAAYGKALSISPNNITVLNNMSLSLAQNGKLDLAISLLQNLVQSEYSTPQVRQNLALFHALNGDLQSAEKLAREDLPPSVVSDNLSSFRLLQEK
tara:strand:+ start:1162 stop:2085 length:924 start_codon:yes stop_codon:yes gene_type:complete